MDNLLEIKSLNVSVLSEGTKVPLLKDISWSVPKETIVSLVGGSGSGKTTTGLAILRLLPPAMSMDQGIILFNNQDLVSFSDDAMRDIRGNEIGMIFQEPLNAFNPVFSIGYQIEEVLMTHTALNRKARQERIGDLLDLVGLPNPKQTAQNFPHQLSGGMRQRAMIAQAIAADPKLIIADEPTSNLDVTLQAKILDLFRTLKEKLKLSILLITHDLGVVAHLAEYTAVMSQGRIIEEGKTSEVLSSPREEYTKQLMEAML